MMEPASPFAIEESVGHDGSVRLTLRGELDLASAGVLAARLERLQSAPGRVRLDLSQLAFIDSSGIGAIVAAIRADRDLEIEDQLAPSVRRVLQVTGVDTFLRDANRLQRAGLSQTT
jgi:anti-sigma B factor antagonist